MNKVCDDRPNKLVAFLIYTVDCVLRVVYNYLSVQIDLLIILIQIVL